MRNYSDETLRKLASRNQSNGIDEILLDLINNKTSRNIDGVEHFYSDSKPLQRNDGSPLIAGDRWWSPKKAKTPSYFEDSSNFYYNPDNYFGYFSYDISRPVEWFWNGTYWLSVCLETMSSNSSGYWAYNQAKPLPTFILPLKKIYLAGIVYKGKTAGAFGFNSANSYWSISYNINTEDYNGGYSTGSFPAVKIQSHANIFNTVVNTNLFIDKPATNINNWPYNNYPTEYKTISFGSSNGISQPVITNISVEIFFYEVA